MPRYRQSTKSPPCRNIDNPLVAAAIAAGAAAPIYEFDRWPMVGQFWTIRATWYIAHRDELSVGERRRYLFDLDLFAGVSMAGRRRS